MAALFAFIPVVLLLIAILAVAGTGSGSGSGTAGTSTITSTSTANPFQVELAKTITELFRQRQANVSQHPCAISNPSPSIHAAKSTAIKQYRPHRIIICVNELYLPALFNWLAFYRLHCFNLADLYIVCLDEPSEKLLLVHGLRCSHVEHSGRNLNKVWTWRVRLTLSLLSQGLDVLICDADAVWLRNPYVTIDRFPHADIITSRGTYPTEVVSRFGTAACMGFILIRASDYTKSFWQLLVTAMSKTIFPNDQRSLNYLLAKRGLAFEQPLVGQSHGHLTSQNRDDHGYAFASGGRRVNITFLSHNEFRRDCNNTTPQQLFTHGVVLHCVSNKEQQRERMSFLSSIGLWLLREDLNTVISDIKVSSFDDHLTSVTHPWVRATS